MNKKIIITLLLSSILTIFYGCATLKTESFGNFSDDSVKLAIEENTMIGKVYVISVNGKTTHAEKDKLYINPIYIPKTNDSVKLEVLLPTDTGKKKVKQTGLTSVKVEVVSKYKNATVVFSKVAKLNESNEILMKWDYEKNVIIFEDDEGNRIQQTSPIFK